MLMYHFSNNKPINSNASLPFNNEYCNSRELSFFPTPSLFYSHLADIPEDRLYKMPRLCMMYFLNKKKKKKKVNMHISHTILSMRVGPLWPVFP